MQGSRPFLLFPSPFFSWPGELTTSPILSRAGVTVGHATGFKGEKEITTREAGVNTVTKRRKKGEGEKKQRRPYPLLMSKGDTRATQYPKNDPN
ncbi:hypothetical protein E2C01_092411 [Portunus trituberculatus]|uniref:Uncharacterized protein n=1 Tax=Portunus trituberculatus TaxID=210409 RepID=A0A5B7JVQ8_PORTR|nr:hypothetical protein [Portunus trituberculatus]